MRLEHRYNLKKNISSIYNTRFFNTFIPITFYYDSSGVLFNSYNFGFYKEYHEYNDMICCSIWKESEKILDYSNKYIINNIQQSPRYFKYFYNWILIQTRGLLLEERENSMHKS